ncbi:tenascin-like [Saccostrea cucullata]|uniref:tenascin-like n=1 Tax=Saccostrea cuccullata TaxID=36930 RepID=UPI002ED28DD5
MGRQALNQQGVRPVSALCRECSPRGISLKRVLFTRTSGGKGRYAIAGRETQPTKSKKSCQCDDNFLPVLGLCLPGNLSVGNECYLSSQCSSTRHADRCVDGYCHCQEGFLLKEQKCLPGTLLLGESCEFNEQCSGTKNAGSCKYAGSVNFTVSKQCNCDEGYSNFRGDCLPGNLSVGQECFRSPQCTNADPAVRCVDGHCLCMDGYQMRGRKCVDDTNKENTKKQKDKRFVFIYILLFLWNFEL